MKVKSQKLKVKSEGRKHESKFEHSAGGVIYRKHNNTVEILLLQDKNGEWSFPKGLIEEDEDEITTAKREISEEVGLHDFTFIVALDTIRYFYRFGTSLIRKRVDFFLFRYDGVEKPQPLAKEGISDVRWFAPDEALSMIGYVKTNKPILEKAMKLLTNNI